MSENEFISQAQKTLPEGWTMVKFGDVVRYVKTDANPENSGLERYVAGEHMQTDDLHITQWGIIGDGYLGPAFHRKFVKGQVLYGSRRTYLRKVAIAEFDGICANTTFVLESKDGKLLPELLPFVMQSESFTEHSVKKSKGSVNPYVNWKDIAIYEFPLPLKEEQHRIADMLWAAEECIVKNGQLVDKTEIYKKILIKELLTKGIGHTNFIQTELGELPEEWKVVKLGPLIKQGYIIYHLDGNHGGLYPLNKDFVNEGIPFLSANAFIDGKVDFTKVKYITETRARQFKKGIAKDGDVLLAHNATVGPVGVLKTDLPYLILGTTLTAYRCDTTMLSNHYLKYFMESTLFQAQLHRIMKQTTRNQVPITAQRNLYFVIPNRAEQNRIVQILSQIDYTSQKIHENINKTKELKKMLINQFLNGGLESAVSINPQSKQLYETQVSE